MFEQHAVFAGQRGCRGGFVGVGRLTEPQMSRWVDNGVDVARNGDGPLVGREPSAEDITTT